MAVVQVHCKYDELVDPKTLRDHPKNRNKHPKEQIARLAKIYREIGIRHAVVISNLSNAIVAGHGRKYAAIEAGCQVPIVRQDFKDAAEEYAFIQADNAIALWAELDLSAINQDIDTLLPKEFDLSLLGIKSLGEAVPVFGAGTKNEQGKLDEKHVITIQCPNCKTKFERGNG